ncbi:carbohydrate binding protein with CBM9 domain [Arcicella aurantiaca]|uniref:Carbohydrate binding protein with CBM9 domain n=1 Tax=Arcicella aurantiaca TaxID=591202 RepID=A0A316ECQ8_9BACT|nr:carbohydrate-binding family 9-like protein [Arcicella aurantiaca]PWK28662.1 carbohydrate binding protein with CBM9 domain [Arcicella aurantiaca]
MKKLFLSGIVCLKLCFGFSQAIPNSLHYTCFRAEKPLKIDGKLNETSWQKAQWTSLFVDIEGDKKPLPTQATKAKMLWDDQYLYIAAELEETNIWAYQTTKDQIVYLENDFEVFIDPDGDTQNYFELEVNAANNTFDLFLPKPYRNGGNALINWDMKNLKTAVHIDGTLNKSKDIDKAWTVEIAIPISSLNMDDKNHLPQDLSFWRINFSRVEWDFSLEDGKYIRKKKENNEGVLPEYNWVWSPQGAINMHLPERWGYLVFSTQNVGATPINFTLPESEKLKQIAWQIYDKQKTYFAKNQRYASNLTELSFDNNDYEISMEATSQTFIIWVSDKAKKTFITLNQDSVLNVRQKP